MSIAWPGAFPIPTLQGYSFKPDESIARTNMDSGYARQRQRFTSVPSRVKVRWIMNQTTFSLFEGWYKFKAKEGAEWMLMDLKNGAGLTENQCRFTSPYGAKVISDDLWEITAELEVREFNSITEAQLDEALGLDGSITDLILAQSDFYKLINEQIPGPFNWS